MTDSDILYLNNIDWMKLSTIEGHATSCDHRDSGIKNFYSYLTKKAKKRHFWSGEKTITMEEMLEGIKTINMIYKLIPESEEEKLLDEIIEKGNNGFFMGWHIRPLWSKTGDVLYEHYQIHYNFGS